MLEKKSDHTVIILTRLTPVVILVTVSPILLTCESYNKLTYG